MVFTLFSIALVGSAIPLSPLSTPSKEDCESTCQVSSLCAGFNYDKEGNCEFFSEITGGKVASSVAVVKRARDVEKISKMIHHTYKKLNGSELLGMDELRIAGSGSLEECGNECSLRNCAGFGFGHDHCSVFGSFDGVRNNSDLDKQFFVRIDDCRACRDNQQFIILPAMIGNSSECGQGWVFCNATKRYYCEGTKAVRYDEAKKACEVVRSLLTSIHSAAEINCLKDLHNSTGGHWIGFRSLSDKIAQQKNLKSWAWIDGSPNDFNRWNTGEPNGCCENTGYMAVVGRSNDAMTWDDISTQKVGRYLCKKI